jgi:sortase (surface protein transpeptidase)
MLFGTLKNLNAVKVGDKVVFRFIDQPNQYEDTLMCIVEKINKDVAECSLAGEWTDLITNKTYPKGYKMKAAISIVRPVN